MNGADISFIVGLVVSGGLYLILCRGVDLDAERTAIVASDRELETRICTSTVNTALGQQRVTAAPVDTVVVSCCQLTPTLGDPGANRERVADAVCHAVSLGARIVVLPELVSSGYVFEDRAEAAASAEPADGETLTLWARLAADHQIVIVGGFCEQAASGEVFNSAALIDPGGLRSVYRKAHLWDAENLLFSPGSSPAPVVSTAYGRIGMLICYDLEIPEWVRLPAMDGANCSAPRSNWPAFPRPDGEPPRRSCACKRMPP